MNYQNQYLGLAHDEKLRTTFEISRVDASKIRQYDSKEGALQTTTSILIKKLINELDKSGIEVGDYSSYQRAVTDATIILGQRGTVVKPTTGRVRAKSTKAVS